MQEQIVIKRREELRPHPDNPRGPLAEEDVADLVGDFRITGKILEPLNILPDGTVFIGNRRLLAGSIVGMEEFPCIVRDVSPREARRLMMVENMKRRDLSLLAEARGYAQLEGDYPSVADMARDLDLAPERINGALWILKFPEAVQSLFDKNKLAFGMIAPLRAVSDPARMEQLAHHAAATGMSVKAFWSLAKPKEARNGGRPAGRVTPIDAARKLRSQVITDLERYAKAGHEVHVRALIKCIERTMCVCAGSPNEDAERRACNECPFSRFINNLNEEVRRASC